MIKLNWFKWVIKSQMFTLFIFCGGMLCGLKLPPGGPFGIIMRGWCCCGPPGPKLLFGIGPPCIGGAWPRGAFVGGGIGRVFCWLSNWASAAFVGNVTTNFWPWISFFPKRSKHKRILFSEPNVTTQKPFDCPLARFSKNFTSWKSETPTELTASVISWSVVHCLCSNEWKQKQITKKHKQISGHFKMNNASSALKLNTCPS